MTSPVILPDLEVVAQPAVDVRLPPPQINSFRSFVKRELNRRKYEYISPIATPFAKMTSCLESVDRKYKFFSLGLHGFDFQDTNIFDLSYGKDKDIIGYAYKDGKKTPIDVSEVSMDSFGYLASAVSDTQLSAAKEQANSQYQDLLKSPIAEGKHPTPGITGVNVERFAMGAGFRTTVSWVCYNRQQLEFLRHHFMTVGTTVVVEWGHEFFDSQKEDLHTLDFSNPDITIQLALCIVKGRDYVIKNFVESSRGNYDFIVGTVSNFSVSIDAETNTYKVTSQIVSSGEFIWGTSIHQTISAFNDTDSPKLSSLADFFKQNSGFDNYINLQSLDLNNKLVQDPSLHTELDMAIKNESDSSIIQTNANDYKFISWPGLFAMLRQAITQMTANASKEQIKNISDFLKLDNSDVRVGDNDWLISNNPESMIIIKQTNAYNPNIPPPSRLTTNGYFGLNSDIKGTASLNYGVWLNTGMVRSAFLNSITLEQAIRTILFSLNNASTGYWDLQILYDEEDSSYKIIDFKCGQSFTAFKELCKNNPLYLFNSGRCIDSSGNVVNPSPSDIIKLNLDSAFPPEVITHLALVSKIRSAPGKWSEELSKYPLFANSAHFAVAMNWTDLQDIVYAEVENLRKTIADSEIKIDSDKINLDLGDSSVIEIQNRIADSNQDMRIRFGPDIRGESQTIENNNSATQRIPQTDSVNMSYDYYIKKYAGEYLPQNVEIYIDPTPQVQTDLSGYFLHPTLDWVNLIKALIKIESNFREDVVGGFSIDSQGNQIGHVGLMQVKNISVLSSPRPLTLKDTRDAKLYGPGSADFNIKSGIQILRDKLEFINGKLDIEATLAKYNGGSTTRRYDVTESKILLSAIADGNIYLARDPEWVAKKFPTESLLLRNRTSRGGFVPMYFTGLLDSSGNKKYFIPKPYRYFNAEYVDNILNYYRLYDMNRNTIVPQPFGRMGMPNSSLEKTTTSPTQPSNQFIAPSDSITPKLLEFQERFGNWVFPLIVYNPSFIRNKILQDGLNSFDGTTVNGFVAPVPTSAKINLTILGISGISLFDGFIVDKLPYIYERFGLFHTVTITENISTTGWVTKLDGIFRFLSFNADANTIDTVPPRL